MADGKYKLYVDCDLVQFSQELSGLSLLRDPLIRLLCPHSVWKITVGDMILDVSQRYPNIILINRTISYFDGNINNVFKIQDGIGSKKYSSIKYDIEDTEMYKIHMKNLIGKLRQDSKNFDGVVDDIEISNFIINSKDMTLVCAVSEYAPLDFMNVWINSIRNNVYHISNITYRSFDILYESWCLGGPMTSSRTIIRDDIDKINFNLPRHN
jgi:hypothetical protein